MKSSKVFINFKEVSGPWGGGNQFLKALKKQLKNTGNFTKILSKADTILINSHHNLELIYKWKNEFHDKIWLHRIDGPISLIRGSNLSVDKNIFEINQEIATTSVFQSQWSLDKSVELGFNPIKPVVIHNASDPDIFNIKGRIQFSETRKIRIISSSWSDNPRKGGPIYKWLDSHLDFKNYDYTFIGRSSENFKNIRIVKPLKSRALAKWLKQSDIYVTASDNDPCSNSLIEALSCGLPAIYLNKGGHPELVKYGGLGFENYEEIPNLLEALSTNYHSYQAQINVSSIGEVMDKYLDVCHFE